MRATLESIAHLLVDPIDRSPLALDRNRPLLRSAGGSEYPLIAGQPNLLPSVGHVSGGWRFDPIQPADLRPRPSPRFRFVRTAPQRAVRKLVGGQGDGERFAELVHADSSCPRVLVIGGATIGSGLSPVLAARDAEVVSFDIYPTNETTFVADAHHIPLCDKSVDGVWIQAVLEHVYRPEDVVAEIDRVLRPGGYVYAETPFLQPVHEAAFDFQRFSASGHRLLFPHFDEVAAGSLGGPGAVLNLACRGLVGGLTRSPALARLAYVATLPLTIVDRFVGPRWRSDFATGVYFLGRLAADSGGRRFDAPATYRAVTGQS